MAAATVAHTQAEAAWCTSVINSRCFDLCRSQGLSLPGFPNFKKVVDELRTRTPQPHPSYEVCLCIGDNLVVREALVEPGADKQDFSSELKRLLDERNKEFNPRGIKRGSAPTAGSVERPAKTLCVADNSMSLDEFETKFTERLDSANEQTHYMN